MSDYFTVFGLPRKLTVDGAACKERGTLGPNTRVSGEDFAFSLEPVGRQLMAR